MNQAAQEIVPEEIILNVYHENDWYIRIAGVNNPADLGENIISLAEAFYRYEVNEKIQKRTLGNYLRMHTRGAFQDVLFNNNLILNMLLEWGDTIKEGAMSTRVIPREIGLMLDAVGISHCNRLLRHGHQPFRVGSDRIINTDVKRKRFEEKREKQLEQARQEKLEREKQPYERSNHITWEDVYTFITGCKKVIQSKWDTNISLNGWSQQTSPKNLECYMRLLSWEDMRKYFRGHITKKRYPQDIKFLKALWDACRKNPTNAYDEHFSR